MYIDSSSEDEDRSDNQRVRSLSELHAKPISEEEARKGYITSHGFRIPGKEEMEQVILKLMDDENLLRDSGNYVCPFQSKYKFILRRVEDVGLIPPQDLGDTPNRVYIQLHLHPAWTKDAPEAIHAELNRFLDVMKVDRIAIAGEPMEDPYIQAGEKDSLWVSAKYHEDSMYALSAFVFFVVSRVSRLYIHEMEMKGFKNTTDKRNHGTWEAHGDCAHDVANSCNRGHTTDAKGSTGKHSGRTGTRFVRKHHHQHNDAHHHHHARTYHHRCGN